MEFNIFLLVGICTIFCTQFSVHPVNALIGPNVREANNQEFPFIASIARLGGSYRVSLTDHLCTAALLSTKHALSASQCLHNRQINNTVIVHGSNALAFSRVYSIQWWITFNEWSTYKNGPLTFQDNDITIIKLYHPIQVNFQPAVLSNLAASNLADEQIVLVGWGISRRHVVAPNMQTSTLKIISIVECEARIFDFGRQAIGVHDRLFCTFGAPNALLQNGDTGGPVLHADKIVGINKQVLPNIGNEFHPRKLNIHTSIDYYREFIADVTHFSFLWM